MVGHPHPAGVIFDRRVTFSFGAYRPASDNSAYGDSPLAAVEEDSVTQQTSWRSYEEVAQYLINQMALG
jgi:hypothetical protein